MDSTCTSLRFKQSRQEDNAQIAQSLKGNLREEVGGSDVKWRRYYTRWETGDSETAAGVLEEATPRDRCD